jgi:hypothetical protein
LGCDFFAFPTPALPRVAQEFAQASVRDRLVEQQCERVHQGFIGTPVGLLKG